jgi:hypothetical protein
MDLNLSLSLSPQGLGFLQFMFKLGFHGKVKPRKTMDTNENTKVGVEVNKILTTPFPCLKKPTTLTKQNKSAPKEKRNKREKQLFSCFCGVFVELRDILHNCNVINFPN